MDMRYHWLTDRVRQQKFDVYSRPGRENLGDYHTTHHSAQHHKDMHGLILHQANSLQVLRGCVKLLPLPQPHLHTRTYDIHIQAPREPLNSRVCWRVCTLSQDRTYILLLSHNFSIDMITITRLNEVHYGCRGNMKTRAGEI
jgi:hypothetical protein